MIAFLQFVVSLSTEIVSTLMLSGQRENFDVIVNFIAIKIINDVEIIFLEGSVDVTLQQIYEEANWQPKIVYEHVDFYERSCGNQLLYIMLKIVKLLYNSAYFYFFPFLILLLNFVSRKCSSVINPRASSADGLVHGVGIVTTAPLCEELEVFYIHHLFTKALFRH